MRTNTSSQVPDSHGFTKLLLALPLSCVDFEHFTHFGWLKHLHSWLATLKVAYLARVLLPAAQLPITIVIPN